MSMAKDDTEYIASGSVLTAANRLENTVESGTADSCAQLAFDGCSSKKNHDDQIKLRTLIFSRSAETVGHLGADLKQTGQRPDRQYTRRPSTSRRGGAVEHNLPGSRYASGKAVYRPTKTNSIRTSKSCTTECEILRVDYTNDYSAAYSAFYDDILRAADESDTFTGIGEDIQGYDREDVTLSESTALIIDNGDLEAKSDITITSRDDGSSSLHCDHVQKSTHSRANGHDRLGSGRSAPRIDSSDECLDSDVSERKEQKRDATNDVTNKPETFGSWTQTDHVRTMKTYRGKEQDAQFSSSEQSNDRLQVHKHKETLVTSQFLADSSQTLQTLSDKEQSHVKDMSRIVNKDLLPSSGLPSGNVLSLKDKDAGEMVRNTNPVCAGSYMAHLALADVKDRTTNGLYKYETCPGVNQLEDMLLSTSSSRLSLPRKRTTPLPQCKTELQQDESSHSSHQGRQKQCNEKRTPYPEELAKAVTEAFNSGVFHTSQTVAGNTALLEYLQEAGQSSEVSLFKAKIDNDESDDECQVRNLPKQPRGKFAYDSPGISILSFNLVKEISDSAMPQRRDHNDVILSDSVPGDYSFSRPGTPLSPTSELHASALREAPKKGSSGDLSQSSPRRASAVAKGSDTSSTCKVMNASNELRSGVCMYTHIEEYPNIPDEYSSQTTRLAIESPKRSVLIKSPNEMDSYNTMANKDMEIKKPILKLSETTGLSPGNAKADGTMNAPVARSTAKSLIKSSVPLLGSHEYLPFLNKLRQEKSTKNRQQKMSKSQRKVSDSAKKNTGLQEEDGHGDAESLASTPLCPVGREVPADWKPGEHSSHPLTKLSASYTGRKLKKRRSIRKKKRVQNRLSPRKKDKEVFTSEINRHVSNFEVNITSPPLPLEASKSCSVINAYDLGSTDTDGNPEDDVVASFEYKRRYYERLSKMVKEDSGSDTKSDHSPIPKRVTSQVRLLKTLDELYSSDSSDEAEGEMPFTDQPLFDINHQTSLFNYYTTRLKHMSVLGNIPQQEESATNKMPYIRIRRVEQEVPSALDHKRLKSLYECRMKKPVLTSKIRKMDYIEQARGRYNDKSDGLIKGGKQMQVVKGYGRSASRTHNLPKIANYKAHGRDVPTDLEESDQSRFKERIVSVDKSKPGYDALSGNAPHRSYLDILKSNIQHPSQASGESNHQTGNSTASRQKAPGAEFAVSKDSVKPGIDEHLQKTQPFRERESAHRARMKVRFADPCNEYKERLPYEISDDDTWSSTVNAMLLRANRVMDDVSKNDHRYPKPDSARVVSPVPPKSPTFLKELLKQDTIERKQAKSNTKVEKRYKEVVVKPDKPETRHSKPQTPLASLTIPGSCSFLAIQPKPETSSTQNNSSLVYSVPVKDGSEQTNVNEKSAGVLKISIQMSKRAQERAWLTHERIKRQRATNAEYEMKSDMKTLPKKLTPLRISKPINFQNPDSRNLERIPMRDVLSKTLMGLSTSSRQIFQPKANVAESSTSSGSNFLLDQHSETLRYFRGPYMHQRSSSIVPLFSDSNNNAYTRDGAEDEPPVEDNLDNNERLREKPNFNQDVFTIRQVEEDICEPENYVDRCSDEDESSSNRHTREGNECYDHSRRKNTQSIKINNNDHRVHETPASVNVFLAGRRSQLSDATDTDGNSDYTFAYGSQHSITDDNVMSTPGADTPVPGSLHEYIDVCIKPKETNKRAMKSTAFSSPITDLSVNVTGFKTSQKVYIPGMRCFENIENDRNSWNVNGAKDEMKYRRNMYSEQREPIEDQFDTQETLLDALVGYEIEMMSRIPFRVAEADSKHGRSRNTGMEADNDSPKLAVPVAGVSEPCSTCYLNQWVPNYQENVLETEKSFPEADHPGCQLRHDDVDNEMFNIHSVGKTSQDLDTIDVTRFLHGIALLKEPSRRTDEAIPHSRHESQSQRPATKPKPQKLKNNSTSFNNFAIHGSTIQLTEKHPLHSHTGVPAKIRWTSWDKTTPEYPKQSSHDDWENPSQSFKLDMKTQLCKTSAVRETPFQIPIKQAAIPRPNQDMKNMNTYFVKESENNSIENLRSQVNQQAVKTIGNLKGNSTQECKLYADAVEDVDNEDISMNKTDCGHFNWRKVKIPPSFTTGDCIPLNTSAQEILTRPEISKAYSAHSVYSTSTVAQYLDEEATDGVTAEGGSRCLHTSNTRDDLTPNFFDSIRDPPNSLCTTTNVKDMTSSACTDAAEINNIEQSAILGRGTWAQTNEEITIDESKTQLTTQAVYENISTRSRTSEVDGGGLSLSHSRLTASGRSLDDIHTNSQISDSFHEDRYEKAVYDPVGDGDAMSWNSGFSDTEEAALQDASEYKQWHCLRENMKLGHVFSNKSAPGPFRDVLPRDGTKRDTLKTPQELLDRNFLKSLRNSDLLHTVSLDRRRLLKSLQLMTRRQGYLPMFQVRSKQAIEMMPQIVTLNHCAKTFIERGSSSFSGTFRCLPIFYTEDDTGFITSIFTVNWIPEGVYSLEKSNMEKSNMEKSNMEKSNMEKKNDEELNKFDNEQAHFGKLLQYSPFASDLAFSNDQAYLIGDEVGSREEAAKTLIVAHDEAGGDVAKYFMLMCGWIPPHINPTAALPNREGAHEGSSEKAESKERDSSSVRKLVERVEYLEQELQHLPAISYVAGGVNPDKNTGKITMGKTPPRLPQIAPAKLVARSDRPPVASESHVNEICKLPAICKSAGIITSDNARPTMMLCLRCGVTVECTQAQTDDTMQQRNVASCVKWQPRSKEPTKTDVRKSPERNSLQRYSRRNCRHSWEVSEVGLAVPLLTTATIKAPIRDKAAKDRTLPRTHSGKRLKLSLKRMTKSQTAFQYKGEFSKTRSALLQVRSHSDIHSKREYFKYIDANVISQVQGNMQRKSEATGRGMLAESTPRSARESSKIKRQGSSAEKENFLLQHDVTSESLDTGSKLQTPTRLRDANPRRRRKSPSLSPHNLRGLKQQAAPTHQSPVKQQAQLKQQVPVKQQLQSKQATQQPAMSASDMEKPWDVDPLVAGWPCNTAREVGEEEHELMEKRTWFQPVIPPPFPASNPALGKLPQKANSKRFQSSRAHLAQHRRNLNQINQSYVSPYWSKKEIKRTRSKTPASDSGDDRSSISHITTISGMSSTSSESNTEEESSTEESDSDSGSSASGSDFFTRYANKGGPTSVDDIFKRTLPRQRLDFKLARLKEAKEKEEIEQLGYLRGKEGATPPLRDHGDNAKDNEQAGNFVLSDYDMCSDADEVKELWKQCFPEVDFWDRKRRKKFKKTKILS